jgi:hypothetical protein
LKIKKNGSKLMAAVFCLSELGLKAIAQDHSLLTDKPDSPPDPGGAGGGRPQRLSWQPKKQLIYLQKNHDPMKSQGLSDHTTPAPPYLRRGAGLMVLLG